MRVEYGGEKAEQFVPAGDYTAELTFGTHEDETQLSMSILPRGTSFSPSELRHDCHWSKSKCKNASASINDKDRPRQEGPP